MAPLALIPLLIEGAATAVGTAVSTILVGSVATATGTTATSGLIGAGGAITAGGAIGAAGIGLSATSAILQGQAASAQGRAQQKIANFNAEQKEREARSRLKVSELEAERVSKREKIFKAEQRASFAKGGISISEFTPLDVLAESAGQFQIERALTLREGLVQSGQLRSQATNLRAEGSLSASLGRQAQTSSFLNAGTSILSGTSRLS